ncbi:6-phosphogluconolactonase [Salmonella enterica subsp. enterica]|uniref:6-phosphogluconolactonase n=1 Tax=Salmonella enterica I TaxID=59201 RepID=A0A379WX02_SALET|nr:6-phosphogluconolactonase [Salmonella enterica subsp. enterica]
MKQTVYTASPESQQIHVWSLNHEGTLTLVQVGGCARSGSADGGQSG